ncbi:MAG: NAD(P)H-binding protein [Bacteroidia bacterium]|nr:NAD(P)H-binding protein [Bacteroidia bacterium]
MKLFVSGAAGRIGLQVIRLALAAGHRVTAGVQPPAGLPLWEADLQIVAANLQDEVELAIVLEGHDALVYIVGAPQQPDKSTYAGRARTLVAAARLAGIERVVVVGGAGILQHSDESLRRDQTDFPAHLQEVTDCHWSFFEALSQSALAWTMVCPPQVSEHELTGQYRSRRNFSPENGQAIGSGDLAHFILRELSARQYLGSRAGIAW